MLYFLFVYIGILQRLHCIFQRELIEFDVLLLNMKPITCVLIVLMLCQLCMITSAFKYFSEDNMMKMKDTAKELGSKMKDKAKEFVKKVKG